ncbi:LolA family protein [Sphingobacterium endophyticum]|uniref:LolA family protein n=1 Tax=Sphingobacterium endophyticum TaxID=2546448 RepID=UPI0012E14542|nr:outer membrane lipoprotein carrier protein LolA [Sphingobacterium endophyticum]
MMMKFMYLLVALFSVTFTFGQNAKSVLDEVSRKYDGYKTIQSDFTFKATQANGENFSDKGQLFLNKPVNQFKINLPAQDLISDGKSTWSVLKEDKEVQVSDADNSGQSIGPNNIFTFYKSGYKYGNSSTTSNGSDGKLTSIDLTPEDSKSNYSKIQVRINKNKHIHDVTIFDKSGAKYTYTINTLYVNSPIAESTFQFNKGKYPGFELVDLR